MVAHYRSRSHLESQYFELCLAALYSCRCTLAHGQSSWLGADEERDSERGRCEEYLFRELRWIPLRAMKSVKQIKICPSSNQANRIQKVDCCGSLLFVWRFPGFFRIKLINFVNFESLIHHSFKNARQNEMVRSLDPKLVLSFVGLCLLAPTTHWATLTQGSAMQHKFIPRGDNEHIIFSVASRELPEVSQILETRSVAFWTSLLTRSDFNPILMPTNGDINTMQGVHPTQSVPTD